MIYNICGWVVRVRGGSQVVVGSGARRAPLNVVTTVFAVAIVIVTIIVTAVANVIVFDLFRCCYHCIAK